MPQIGSHGCRFGTRKHNDKKITPMAMKREIRNSTAEFLTFVAEGKEQGVQVLYKDETVWATQKAMATLFDVGVPAINKHLKNIFEAEELKADAAISKMEITAADGKNYQTTLYNLDAQSSMVMGMCRSAMRWAKSRTALTSLPILSSSASLR